MRLRLSLLNPLLLLGMPLLHLLGLLLMALLDLLLAACVGILSCESLVFFFLPLLKFLPVFLLLRVHFLLLLLIFLFLLGVTGIRGGAFHRRQVVRMNRAPRIVFGRSVVSSGVARSGISRTAMDGAALARRHDSAAAECAGSGGGSDRRFAMVYVSPKLRIRPRLLHLLPLTRSRRKAATARG